MRRRARSGVVLGLILSLVGGAQATAQTDTESVQATVLTQQRFAIPDHLAGGHLRIRLEGLSPTFALRVTLEGLTSREVLLTQDTIEPYLVQRRDGEALVDVPAPESGYAFAEVLRGSARPLLVAVRLPRGIGQEQIIGLPDLRYLDSEVSDPRLRMLGRGVGRLEARTVDGMRELCTAFRVASQLWLTAAHCLRVRGRPAAGLALTLDAYAPGMGPLGIDPLLRVASVVVDGLTEVEQLDVALLRTVDVPEGPIVPMRNALAVREGQWLGVLQHWSGHAQRPRGKAYSADTQCRAGMRGPEGPGAARSCFGSALFQHGCDTEGGSSGAPILDRSSLRVVGLNIGGGELNAWTCGVTISAVARLICRAAPDAGGVIGVCPVPPD